MFTGLIEEVGEVRSVETDDRRGRVTIRCREVVSDVAIGDSIAVNGCCLTVTALLADGGARTGFVADLMVETLRVTGLGDLEAGDGVNLERPLRADGRFGGHLVQGHVDAVGAVTGVVEDGGTVLVRVEVPPEVAPYLVAKGSISVQGVSLTVIDVDRGPPCTFRVGLVPHTRAITTLGRVRTGDRVNLEVDIVAKYVEALVAATEVVK